MIDQRLGSSFTLAVALCLCPAVQAGVSRLLGAGNMTNRDAEQQDAGLAGAGLSMTRIPIDVGAYWDKKPEQPKLKDAEDAILTAQRHGVRPVILLEYYTRTDGDIGQDAFKAMGRAYAERFRPNSPWFLGRGLHVLEDHGGCMWVWQNRKGWSSIAGGKLRMERIPAWATKLEVSGWNGSRKTVPAGGSTHERGLPEGETHMIVDR